MDERKGSAPAERHRLNAAQRQHQRAIAAVCSPPSDASESSALSHRTATAERPIERTNKLPNVQLNESVAYKSSREILVGLCTVSCASCRWELRSSTRLA